MKLLADLVLVVHGLFILFVVAGFVLTIAGGLGGWRWVRNGWFRTIHLVCIGIVVLQTWFGVLCPLTTWENELRVASGGSGYDELGFIATWLRRLIFFEAQSWVFTLVYTLFGAAVLATWIWVPPRFRHTD